MAVVYGVLRVKVDRWKREDGAATPHLQIRVVDQQGTPYRIPVNVRSSDKSLVVFHRADPLLSNPIVDGIAHISNGLTDLVHATRTASNALDYFRSPLFDWPTGVALPPTGSGPADDLQDAVSEYLGKLKTANGELIAFGSHWTDPAPKPGIDKEFGTRFGMHDIHMNQGNPAGSFAADNGVFNDGGLILKFPDHLVWFKHLWKLLPFWHRNIILWMLPFWKQLLPIRKQLLPNRKQLL